MEFELLKNNGESILIKEPYELNEYELSEEKDWLRAMLDEYEDYFKDKKVITIDEESGFDVDGDKCEYVLGELWVNGKTI